MMQLMHFLPGSPLHVERAGTAPVIIFDSLNSLSEDEADAVRSFRRMPWTHWESSHIAEADIPGPGQPLIDDANKPALIEWGESLRKYAATNAAKNAQRDYEEVFPLPFGLVARDDGTRYFISPDYEYIPWKQAGWSVSWSYDPMGEFSRSPSESTKIITSPCSSYGVRTLFGKQSRRMTPCPAARLHNHPDKTNDRYSANTELLPGIGTVVVTHNQMHFYTEEEHWAQVAESIIPRCDYRLTQASPKNRAQIFAKDLFLRQLRSGTRNDQDNR